MCQQAKNTQEISDSVTSQLDSTLHHDGWKIVETPLEKTEETIAEIADNLINLLLTTHTDRAFHLCLTGGRDMFTLFEKLTKHSLISQVNWQKVHFWWADERYTYADSQQRNCLVAREKFLNYLVHNHNLPNDNIHEMASAPENTYDWEKPIESSNNDLMPSTEVQELMKRASLSYNAELVRMMGSTPSFDLLLLGMGPDGHFASLFPHFPQIQARPIRKNSETLARVDDSLTATQSCNRRGEQEAKSPFSHNPNSENYDNHKLDNDYPSLEHSFVLPVYNSPKIPPMRLTLTADVLAQAQKTWVLASGSKKRELLPRIAEKYCDPQYPASYIAGQQECIWFVSAKQ